jgi:hypothetical protein
VWKTSENFEITSDPVNHEESDEEQTYISGRTWDVTRSLFTTVTRWEETWNVCYCNCQVITLDLIFFLFISHVVIFPIWWIDNTQPLNGSGCKISSSLCPRYPTRSSFRGRGSTHSVMGGLHGRYSGHINLSRLIGKLVVDDLWWLWWWLSSWNHVTHMGFFCLLQWINREGWWETSVKSKVSHTIVCTGVSEKTLVRSVWERRCERGGVK